VFHDIYGQRETVVQLQKSLRGKRLPSALLFQGPRYAGRLSLAVETARIRSCTSSGESGCLCSNCRMSQVGGNPYTVLMLSRDVMPEIRAGLDLLQRVPNSEHVRFFMQQVRKLIGKYQSELFEDTSANAKLLLKAAFEIDEKLVNLESQPINKKTAVLAEKISGDCEKLAASAKSGNIPVSQIRKITTWSYSTPEHSAKTIILEGIEKISDASKNALLKTLEEPPNNTLFIIISEQPGALPLTILSRVRKYQISERLWPDQEKVIRSVFEDDPDNYDSIKTFFMVKSGIDCRSLRSEAELYVASLLQRKDIPYSALQGLLSKISKEKLYAEFITETIQVLEEEVDARLIPSSKAAAVMQELHSAYAKNRYFNQNPALSLEALHNSIRYGLK
jgi:DNA polymerase III delta prime subunit